MKICVYPGSFDPITNGHYDIIQRASQLFDKIIVAVVHNPSKKSAFTINERVQYIERVTSHIPNIEVDCFQGLLIDFVKIKGAHVVIRGLRAISDFEYEFQMALMNHKLDPHVETVFLMTNSKFSYLSSSIVKEVGKLGGCIKGLVPEVIYEELRQRLLEL